MSSYRRVRKLSTFRSIALAFWDAPKDGTIYGQIPVDATNALEYIERLKHESGENVSMATIVGRAIALAWHETPSFNAKMVWGTIYEKEAVDVFFHVDIGGGQDLAGVVVRNAHSKTPVMLAQELRQKAEKLRRGQDEQYEKTQKGVLGKLPPFFIGAIMRLLIFLELELGLGCFIRALGAKEDAFGTVMITNVAPFGIMNAYAPMPGPSRVPAVIVLPAMHDDVCYINGKFEVRPTFTLCGTFDHRFGDGAQLGRIQRRVFDYMHDPYRTEKSLAAGQGLPRVKRIICQSAAAIRSRVLKDLGVEEPDSDSEGELGEKLSPEQVLEQAGSSLELRREAHTHYASGNEAQQSEPSSNPPQGSEAESVMIHEQECSRLGGGA